MDLEQLRIDAKLAREMLGANYPRYLDLLRHAELAEKVMEIDNPRQKHIALSHLIDKIAKDLPSEIVNQRDLLLSNHTLRFNDLCSDILPLAIYGGTQFSHCAKLLTDYRKEVEQWECDDEATIAMRKERLTKLKDCFGYKPFEPFDANDPLGGNDHYYYRGGAYREYDEHKNSYYYRLGRMIQTHDADGCSLEITMQMACFYVALSNERSLVENELELLGITVPGENRQMQWSDVSELREAASGYLSLLQTYDFVNHKGDDIHKTISRLRNAIAKVDLESVGDVLKRYNVNQTKIIYECESLERILLETISVMGNNLPKLKKIDPDVAKTFQLLNRFYDILLFEIEESVLSRCTTDPTKGDVDAGERLKSYLNGDYGDMEFRWFYGQFVECYDIDEDYKPNDLTPGDFEDMLCSARIRRLNYLISICPNDKIKTIMNERVEKLQHEIDTRYNAVPIDTPEPPGNMQTAQPPLPPSAEATATDDAAQFTPTITFDMSALYSFLVDEGVIDDVDKQKFADCIVSANIKPLWETSPSKNTLKLALSVLKEYYQDNIQKRKRINPSWYLHCCESVGMSAQDMSKMNIKKLKRDNFCREMKKSISLP